VHFECKGTGLGLSIVTREAVSPADSFAPKARPREGNYLASNSLGVWHEPRLMSKRSHLRRVSASSGGLRAAVEVIGARRVCLARLLRSRKPFDELVLDVMLPGKSGFKVAASCGEEELRYPS